MAKIGHLCEKLRFFERHNFEKYCFWVHFNPQSREKHSRINNKSLENIFYYLFVGKIWSAIFHFLADLQFSQIGLPKIGLQPKKFLDFQNSTSSRVFLKSIPSDPYSKNFSFLPVGENRYRPSVKSANFECAPRTVNNSNSKKYIQSGLATGLF